jgi:hypothetical protein
VLACTVSKPVDDVVQYFVRDYFRPDFPPVEEAAIAYVLDDEGASFVVDIVVLGHTITLPIKLLENATLSFQIVHESKP